MWSGDIGANMKSLSAHLNAQMHMSLSGVDYFGSDVGGFHRDVLEGDKNEVYTRWFANSALFDVPLRPHTDNGTQQEFTAPDRIGDMKSNLFNLRQRYELAPYYYSLAYRAYQYGEAVVPPLVYHFQEDQNVRMIADEKMIGSFLLAAASAKLGETSRDVYLPEGSWIDYHSGKWYHSAGQVFPNLSIESGQVLRLPLFARSGAILPIAHIDDQTQNILGKRNDGSEINDVIVRVVAGKEPTQFHLIEDDGTTESYKKGQFTDTLISQVMNEHSEVVTIGATTGTYAGAKSQRANQVELILENPSITSVRVNNENLAHYTTSALFQAAKSGWMIDKQKRIHAKSAVLSSNQAKRFEFSLVR